MLKADNLPPSYAIVRKSGKLNFLQPFGPLRACKGTALPLPVIVCLLGPNSFLSTEFLENWLYNLKINNTSLSFHPGMSISPKPSWYNNQN